MAHGAGGSSEAARAFRQLRTGAAASGVAAGAFAFLAVFGWAIFLPGRGSEPAIAANALGPALLLLAAAHAGLAGGYRALVPSPPHARAARAVSLGAAVAFAAAGAIFLLDRVPCTEGLYCAGQVLGETARFVYFVWALLPSASSILLASIALPARPAGDEYRTGFALLLVDGVLFGFFIVPVAIWIAFILGVLTYVILAATFVHEARRILPPGSRRAEAATHRPNV